MIQNRQLNPELLTLLILSLLPVQALCAERGAKSLTSNRWLVSDAPDSLSIFLDKLNAEKKAATPSAPAIPPTPSPSDQNSAPKGGNAPPNDAISGENLKRLNSLESQYFFQQYPNDSTEVRLSRLEKFVFGEVSKGVLEDRLTTLEQSLAVRDPNTGKPIIVQPVPKAPPPDGQAVSTPPVVTTPNSAPSTLLYPDAIDPTPQQSTGASSAPPQSSPTASKPSAEANDSSLALHLGKTHFSTSTSPDLLIHQLNVAIQDSSSPGNLFFQRAKAYIQISKWDAALNDLSNAINDIPNNADFYLARALVQHQLGNGVLAGEDLKRARFYNPKLPIKIDFDDPGIAASK